MKLNLQNCGGVRLVPYGGSAPVTYGWGDFHQTDSVTGGGETVTINVDIEYPWVDSRYSMIMPNFRTARPILDIGGMVYIPNVAILTDAHAQTQTFAVGGYLGTRTITISYSSSSAGTASVSFDSLAVIPAQFSGGIVVSGLSVTGQSLIHGTDPNRYQNYETAFVTDYGNADFYNNGTDTDSGWSWLVSCAIGYDFYRNVTIERT